MSHSGPPYSNHSVIYSPGNFLAAPEVAPQHREIINPPSPDVQIPLSPDLISPLSPDNQLLPREPSPEFLEVHVNSRNIIPNYTEEDAQLMNDSDESNDASDGSSNSSEVQIPVPPQSSRMIKNSSAHQFWSIPKELYNREIGNYNNRGNWSKRFYQSEVALKKLKISKQLKGHQNSVNTLNFHSGGQLMVSGSLDSIICLWDWSLGACLINISGVHNYGILQTKFLPPNSNIRIISSGCDGKVVLTIANSCDVVFSKVLARHDRRCHKICTHDDLLYTVLSCGEDGVVKNIDVRESIYMNYHYRHSQNILYVKHSNGGIMRLFGMDINPMKSSEFIVNGEDRFIRMYDYRKISPIPIKMFSRLPKNRIITYDENFIYNEDLVDPRFRLSNHVSSAVYNYCGTEILASYFEDDIYLFDVNGAPESYVHCYQDLLNKKTDKPVTFYGPNSEYVVCGTKFGRILIWNKTSEALVLKKHADENACVRELELHRYLPVLANCGRDKTIKIWEPLNQCQEPKKPKFLKPVNVFRPLKLQLHKLFAIWLTMYIYVVMKLCNINGILMAHKTWKNNFQIP